MTYYLVVLALVLLFLSVLLNQNPEPFESYWNFPTRLRCPTINQSYDIRGDPIMTRTFDLKLQQASIGPQEPASCAFRQSLFME